MPFFCVDPRRAPARTVPLSALLLLVPGGCGDAPAPPTSPGPAGATAASAAPSNAELVAANDALKAEDATDSDGDGLADGLEAQLGTSPFLADTDFDGYDDGRELLALGFDPGPNGNPVRFNPRTADVPRLEVRVNDVPRVYLTHTMSDSSTQSFDNSSSVENSSGFSTTRGGGSSVRNELSATVGTRASATAGMNAGVTAEVSASVTGSQAHETSLNWSGTQSRDHRRTLSQSRSFSESSDVTSSGGRVEVAVDLHNVGNVAFTLSSLALRLKKYDPVSQRSIDIASLEPETDRVFSGITSLTPGEALGGMVFKAVLELEEAELLLSDGPMTVETLHYDLQDVDARSFDHRYTDILANTTALTIDRGDGEVPATYFVAAHTPDGDGLPLSAALADVLGFSHRVGTTLWRQPGAEGGPAELRDTRPTLLELDGLAADAGTGSYWVVRVTTRTGDRASHTDVYHPLRDGPELADLRLKSNQSAELMYVRDADGDGLGARAEAALGLNPRAADTDGDGVPDGAELERGTNPHHGVAMVDPVGIGSRDRTLTLDLRVRPREGGSIDGLQIRWGAPDTNPSPAVAALSADGALPRNPVVFAGSAPAEPAVGSAETIALASRPGDPADFMDVRVTHEYPAFGDYTLQIATVENGVVAEPNPVRVRVAPALVQAATYVVPETSMMTALATHPDGGVVLYHGEVVDKKTQPRLVRLDRDARPRWTRELPDFPADTSAASRIWLAGGRIVEVGPDGNIYLARQHQLHCLNGQGEPLWASGALKEASEERTEVHALAVGDAGRVFVGGRHKQGNQRQPFVSRLGAAASLAWTVTPAGLPSRVDLLAVPGPRQGTGVVAVGRAEGGGTALVRLDGAGQGQGLPVVHPHPVAALAVTPDGTAVLGGGITRNDKDEAGKVRINIQAGVWAFASGGGLAWGELTPSGAGQSMVKNVVSDRAGWVYTVSFASESGVLADPDPDNPPALNLRVDVRDPAGRLRSQTPVASLAGQNGFGVLLLPVSLAVEGRDVWVAWTHQGVGAAGAASDPLDANVHVARWEPNPRGTRLLSLP